MKILVTGGLGYIGSHTVLELLSNNHEVCIIDNLQNSKYTTKITLDLFKSYSFFECDLVDESKLVKVFKAFMPDIVIHFAGLKNVLESFEKPLLYYKTNLLSSLNLFNVMKKFNCKHLVFSSSATIYGNSNITPITEEGIINPENAYGRSKWFIEEMIFDWVRSYKFSAIILRYFNPIGSHLSGMIGDDPVKPSNSLIQNISNVYLKKSKVLKIYGDDYNTCDGTPLRDFVHVSDLARAHLKASNYIINTENHLKILNIGTGKGTTVLQLIKTFEKSANIKIPYMFVERRKGDIGVSIANIDKAQEILSWNSKYSLNDMCKSTVKWLNKKKN
ncbi:UDP-glucose 4-epimerase GalE [Alphaproteobacteria bacterium]|nr:UDP-glucose 4-epimerase GalE [Alphaproteobacteria bacterium]